MGALPDSNLQRAVLSPVYNLSGIYMGEETDSLPRGIYIQAGKKMLK